jgi:DNA repair protein SbcC/Rad50
MKILAIRGANLASLAHEFAIELAQAPLAAAGVFAIVGNTGAGKSTLLDAMCLALFDRMPRLALRSSVLIGRSDDELNQLGAADVRAILRRGAANGFAEVDFESDDRRRYRARWSVRRARGKQQGALQHQELTLTALDSGEILGGKKTETLAAIRLRLGLSFDQFRRSVLLAQGDFAAFLRADSKERSELLERMTGTQIYSQISKLAHANASDHARQQHELRTTAAAIECLDEIARTALVEGIAAKQLSIQQVQQDQRINDALAQWHIRGSRLSALRTEGESHLQAALLRMEQTSSDQQRLRLCLEAEAYRGQWQQFVDAEIRKQQASARRGERETQLQREQHQREQCESELLSVAARLELLRSLLQREAVATPIRQDQRYLDMAKADEAIKALQHCDMRAQWNEAGPVLQSLLPQGISNRVEHSKVNGQLSADKVALAQLATAEKMLRSELQQAEQQVELAKREAAGFDKKRVHSPEAGRRKEDVARVRLADLRRLCDIRDQSLVCRNTLQDVSQRQTQRNDELARYHSEALALSNQLAHVITEVNEAIRALQTIRDVATLAKHRAELQPGKPCPLCGATKHPWAKRDSIDDAIDEQQRRVDELNKLQQQILQQRSECEVMQRVTESSLQDLQRSVTLAATRIDELTADWSSVHVELGMLPLIATPSDASAAAWLSDQLASAEHALSASQIERERTEKIAQAATEAIGIVHSRQLVSNDLQNRLSELDLRRASLTSTMESASTRLIQIAEQFAAHWATLQPALTAVGLMVPGSSATELVSLQTEAKKAWRQVTDVERDGLVCFGVVLGHRESMALQANQTAQKIASLTSAVAADTDEISRCTEQGERQTIALTAAAAALEVEQQVLIAVFEIPRAVVDELSGRIAVIEAQLLRAQQMFDERQRAWAEHEVQKPPSPVLLDLDSTIDSTSREWGPSELAAHGARLEIQLRQRQHEGDQLRAALAVDESNVARRKDLYQQLESAEFKSTTIAALADVIGSHDGKVFRAFAQGLTLDALLEQANMHLQGLAPRYGLERVPAQDLEIQVIDRDMADEIRGVASLSGGESFLISLALALGLSSLASHSVRVQSLFIDEGFGTLDPATLDTALAVLDGLQASGRQVGIISHVPTIAERVGATIRVVNLGAGRSRVRVDGAEVE